MPCLRSPRDEVIRTHPTGEPTRTQYLPVYSGTQHPVRVCVSDPFRDRRHAKPRPVSRCSGPARLRHRPAANSNRPAADITSPPPQAYRRHARPVSRCSGPTRLRHPQLCMNHADMNHATCHTGDLASPKRRWRCLVGNLDEIIQCPSRDAPPTTPVQLQRCCSELGQRSGAREVALKATGAPALAVGGDVRAGGLPGSEWASRPLDFSRFRRWAEKRYLQPAA